MSSQIFQQSNPPPFQYIRMYTVPYSNLGVQGTLFAVNQGTPATTDYETNCDYISIGLASGPVPLADSWVAWDVLMPPGHTAQWQQLCIAAGESLYIYNVKGQTSFTFTGTSFDV